MDAHDQRVHQHGGAEGTDLSLSAPTWPSRRYRSLSLSLPLCTNMPEQKVQISRSLPAPTCRSRRYRSLALSLPAPTWPNINLCLPPSLSFTVCICRYHSLSLSLSVSVCVSVSFSLTQKDSFAFLLTGPSAARHQSSGT